MAAHTKKLSSKDIHATGLKKDPVHCNATPQPNENYLFLPSRRRFSVVGIAQDLTCRKCSGHDSLVVLVDQDAKFSVVCLEQFQDAKIWQRYIPVSV